MKKSDQWLLAAGFAVFFIFLNGYQFNNGDQEEHMPYVYKLLQPELYPADYIVSLQVEHFTVRFYFAHFMAFFMQWIPPWPLVFGFYFICLMIIGYALTGLAAYKSNKTTAPFIALLIFVLVNRYTVGGNALLVSQLVCSVVALAIGALAVLNFETGKTAIWALLCGLAVLFQPLVGLQLFVLLFGGYLWKNGLRKMKEAGLSLLIFAIFSAPMLLPVFRSFFSLKAPGSDELYYKILYDFRNPHHYLPECFPLSDYMKTGFWWAVILLAAWFFYRRGRREVVIPVMALSFAGCVVYSLCMKVLDLPQMGMTQWFKSTTWTGFIGIPVVAAFVADNFRPDLRLRKIHRIVIAVATLMTFCFIVFSGLQPVERIKARFKTSFYSEDDLGRMHRWIRENTPVGAVVLPCPDDHSFMSEAGRSIPVGYKAIIHEKGFMLEWYERMQTIYGVTLLPGDCDQDIVKRAETWYSTALDADIKSPQPIDYRLVRANYRLPEDWQDALVHREGEFLLLKFRP